MTRRDFIYTAPVLASLLPAQNNSTESDNRLWKLWYRQPAVRWLDALPAGNGRLAAMVFGGIDDERIDLNESTVWSGAPNQSDLVPSAQQHLGPIRQLLFDGKYVEANELCRKYFTGREDSFGTHLPAARLTIHTDNSSGTNYERSLDLETGLARVKYKSGASQITRELFVSNPDQVIALRISSEGQGQVSFALSVTSGELPGEVNLYGHDTLVLAGSAWEKMHSDGKIGVNFQVRVQLLNEGGIVKPDGSSIRVQGADAVTILVAANTNYQHRDPQQLCIRQLADASRKTYAQLRSAHVKDHQNLYRRVSINLGGAEASERPTDERLAAIAKGGADPHLAALFFQYGRYLLVAGSRSNSPLPMNLQGIWNDSLASKMGWTCDFHLDINTQQNYWHAENCNLSECNEPLIQLVERLAEEGRQTARELYGAKGWVCHVYSNAWGFTAPGKGIGWGLFVTGGAWVATHLWEHYRFNRDRDFLAHRAYPVLKGLAEFFLEYMVADPKRGWLVTGPSISPENEFLSPDGKRCSASMGPTCDRELVYATFTSCVAAATILGIDAEFQTKIIAARKRLAPFQIGKYGQLQEWLEDFEEAEPNHRHTSHLLALYPLDQITLEKTPEFAQAARKTLERRLGQSNWEDVEWSRANLVNFFARLQDGEAAHKHLMGLLSEDTDHNLLTFSRGGVAGAQENIFAIDGNTAGAAGIAEMLLQSHGDLHLLPALPASWRSGTVTGLRARGGFEIDLEWSDGTLKSATVNSKLGGQTNVRYGNRKVKLHLKPGSSIRYNHDLHA